MSQRQRKINKTLRSRNNYDDRSVKETDTINEDPLETFHNTRQLKNKKVDKASCKSNLNLVKQQTKNKRAVKCLAEKSQQGNTKNLISDSNSLINKCSNICEDTSVKVIDTTDENSQKAFYNTRQSKSKKAEKASSTKNLNSSFNQQTKNKVTVECSVKNSQQRKTKNSILDSSDNSSDSSVDECDNIYDTSDEENIDKNKVTVEWTEALVHYPTENFTGCRRPNHNIPPGSDELLYFK